jgi:hypothetical protein
VTWFKVDDNLAFHAKVVQAGNAAMGMWVRAGSWCAQQLTDGFVPDHMVGTLGTKGQAKALVEAGLWHREGKGYRFHQWNEDGRQPTRESVEKDRTEARERMRKAREAKKEQACSGDVRPNTQRTSGGVRSTRPDPTRPDLGEEELGGNVTEVDARAPEPPRCSKHKGLRRADIPDCWACGHLRRDWESQRTADTVFERAAWCGSCDAHTRQLETPVGVIRCPECHPLAEESA